MRGTLCRFAGWSPCREGRRGPCAQCLRRPVKEGRVSYDCAEMAKGRMGGKVLYLLLDLAGEGRVFGVGGALTGLIGGHGVDRAWVLDDLSIVGVGGCSIVDVLQFTNQAWRTIYLYPSPSPLLPTAIRFPTSP